MNRLFSLCVIAAAVFPSTSLANTITYGFDDGTFQGWELVLPDGSQFPADESDSGWAPSNEVVDIGDGFTLLTATSGDYRVIPDPWSTRDCLGGALCYTQVLRSPSFFFDGSGDLSIDMIGGGAQSERAYDPDIDLEPSEPEDLPELKDSSGYQGFAVLDVDANAYVAYGFSTHANDGKARVDDPVTRKDWQTVSISQEELADFANNGKQYLVDIFDSYSGGWGWIGFDTVRIPGSTQLGTPGDFDSDGDLDGDDIEALSAAVRAGDMDGKWDVDGSSAVDNDDRIYWVNELKRTYLGDSNLDLEFNSSDLVATFTVGEYEDAVDGNSTWTDGDWNGDSDFNSTDFVAAFTAGGYEAGKRNAAAAVPEPTSVIGFLMGTLGLLVLKRRRSRRHNS